MPEPVGLPRFEKDLAEFIADLRANSFSSILEAARFFKISRSTASRYEGGQLVPPLGYLAALAYLFVEKWPNDQATIENKLLVELNRVLRWYYRQKEPDREPFKTWGEIAAIAQLYLSQRQQTTEPTGRQEDWGEVVEVRDFYGRERELAELEQWIITDRCRLIALLGMGGIGKTTLSIKIAQQFKQDFDYVIWRSLRNSPLPHELLIDCLKVLNPEPEVELPNSTGALITLLLSYLQKSRVLLVLDNVESLMQAGTYEGQYHNDYRGYSELFQRIAQSSHKSCVIITSREKPKEVKLLEGKDSLVRSMLLPGLEEKQGRKILENRELIGSEAEFVTLINRYSGNPLALKLVSGTVRELFNGNINEFLKEGELVFGDVSLLLTQQFERLSSLEQQVMYWLAIERKPVSIGELSTDIVPSVPRKNLIEALESLRARSMLERGEVNATFTQQPVVMEYITGRIIEIISNAILNGVTIFFTDYALMKAQTQDYVRESQMRLIVKPVLEQLVVKSGSEQSAQTLLIEMLDQLRELPRSSQKYGGGNVANLLRELKSNLRDLDFSGLNLWQANLAEVEMQDTLLIDADLSGSVFTDTFDDIMCVSFSPDGKLLAVGCTNGEIRIWRVGDNQPISIYKAHDAWIMSLAFSPNGSLLASAGDDNLIKLWEVETNQLLKILADHTDRVRSVVFSPDGRILASGGDDQTIRLWDANPDSGVCLKRLEGHTAWVNKVAFNSTGDKLVSGSSDTTIGLWNLETGELLQSWSGHTGPVWTVAFSPDGLRVASGGDDYSVRLWQVSGSEAGQVLQGPGGPVRSVVFSPDGQILACGGDDRIIRFWDATDNKLLRTLQGHGGRIWSVAFSPDSRLLASGSDDRQVKIWEVRSGQSLRTLQGHGGRIWSVAFSPDGQLLAGGGDERTLKLWRFKPDSPPDLRILQGHTNSLRAVAFSPDGQNLASGGVDQTVRLWNLSQDARQRPRILRGHRGWVWSVAFSPNGQNLASGDENDSIRLWALPDGQHLHTLEGHSGHVCKVVFTPDNTKLVSAGSDQSIKVWEVSTGKLLASYQAHDGWVLFVTFSPDGTILASSGGDGLIKLWETKKETWECIATLKGHNAWVWSLDFSPDGQFIVSGGSDSQLRLWRVSSGECLNILEGHTGRVRSVVYQPHSLQLASGSEDGTVRLWDSTSGQSTGLLRSDRPYERLNISGATGLTEAQRANLKSLGALED